MKPVIIIHYNEIALKGKNRSNFERQLVENIKRTLKDAPVTSVQRLFGRIVVALKKSDFVHEHLRSLKESESGFSFSQNQEIQELKGRLKRVFGISGFSFGLETGGNLSSLEKNIWSVVRFIKDEAKSFALRVKRSDKTFPHTSMEIARNVGGLIKDRSGWKVDLEKPDLNITVEVAEKQKIFFYFEKISGHGGLPVGSSGRLLSLLSSGFDSPVASYLMMKRGATVDFLHFHSYPYSDNRSLSNVKKIVSILSQYQGKSTVYFAPLGEVQKRLLSLADQRYLVILYRRMMVRVANKIARKKNISGLITGENLGQVASQTIENIAAIREASNIPILRPLIGFNKDEIISLGDKIGTAEISRQPYEDCCSRFIPKNPVTKARLEDIEKIEQRLPIDEWAEMVFGKVEIETL